MTPLDHAGALVTLVEGSTFCLCDRAGDVTGGTHGLFVLDARMLSRFVLRIDDEPVRPLTFAQEAPYSAAFVAHNPPVKGARASELLLFRRRHVGFGLREDLELRNVGQRNLRVRVELLVSVDFADIFAVKQGRVVAKPIRPVVQGDRLVFDEGTATAGGAPAPDGGGSAPPTRRVQVTFGGSPTLRQDGANWEADLAPGARWSACVSLACAIDSVEVPPGYSCTESVDQALPAQRLRDWRRRVAQVSTEHGGLARAMACSVADLGALQSFDPAQQESPVVAAGAPWYMALFGRDSLLTGWMALLLDPDLAFGSMEALARLQGVRTDPTNEEQPGRILHEVRTVSPPGTPPARSSVYYGTVDATPLFVMLLGEVHRWGLYPERVQRLLPAADRAIQWMQTYGDADRDGYVEYAGHGRLVNQCWKDSPDGVPFADGSLPVPPIAVCEAQGYAYAAYLARAELAEAYDDPQLGTDCRERAASLRAAFNRTFWLPERGWYALALDGGKRPVDALASNIGHCLWTGIVDEDHAGAVAEALLAPEMFTGWGVRTLATTMASYNPLSYHNGSVWPHDNAIAAAGLTRYGFVEPAERIISGTIAAADSFDGRLPELFAGLDRDELPVPVSYPASCSPQAWSAAAPLLLLRSLLRLEPDLPRGRLQIAATLPPDAGPLTVRGVRLGSGRIDIVVAADGQVTVEGLPAGVRVAPC